MGQRNGLTGTVGLLGMVVAAVLGGILGGLLVLQLVPGLLPDPAPPQLAPPPPVAAPGATLPQAHDAVVSVVERVGPAVVGVVSRQVLRDFWTGQEYEHSPGGSGVFIDAAGYIVTNYHVIEGAQDVLVHLHDGRQLEAEVVGIDPPTDLAVLRVGDGEEEFVYAVFADSESVRVGQLAVAIGNPISMRFQRSVTVGVVSGIRDMLYGQHQSLERVFQLVQTDASINPGNSGGPLLDGDGAIIGINTLKITTTMAEGMGFAIPAATVERIATDLVAEGRVRRAWMGITVTGVEEIRARQDVDLPDGVYLATVTAAGPAAAAGLKSGDVLTAVDQVPLTDTVELLMILEHARPGQELAVTYFRAGATTTTSVVLTEMPRYWE